MKKIAYLLYFLLILLTIYSDSIFYKFFGEFGRNISCVLSIVIIPVLFFIEGKISIPKESILYFKLGFFVCIISLVFIFVVYILTGTIFIMGENLFVKSFKSILTYFSFLVFMICIYNLGKRYTIDKALFPFFISLITMTFICFIEKKEIPYAFMNLHAVGEFPYYRIRLLSLEASTTVLPFFIYFILSLIYCSRKKNKYILYFILLLIYFYYLYTTGSKAFIITSVMLILYYLWSYRKKVSKKLKTIFLVVLIIMVILFVPNLIREFVNDYKNYTSIVTRLYTMIVGLITGIIFPFGVGNSGYLYFYPFMLKKLIVLSNLLGGNNYEIYILINSTNDTFLTVKSGILHQNMIWGIVGTCFFLRNYISNMNSYSGFSKKLMKSLMFIVLFSITFFAPFTSELYLVLGISFILKKQDSIDLYLGFYERSLL